MHPSTRRLPGFGRVSHYPALPGPGRVLLKSGRILGLVTPQCRASKTVTRQSPALYFTSRQSRWQSTASHGDTWQLVYWQIKRWSGVYSTCTVAAPDHKIRQCIQKSALFPGRADRRRDQRSFGPKEWEAWSIGAPRNWSMGRDAVAPSH